MNRTTAATCFQSPGTRFPPFGIDAQWDWEDRISSPSILRESAIVTTDQFSNRKALRLVACAMLNAASRCFFRTSSPRTVRI
jgi:hypothetical protein